MVHVSACMRISEPTPAPQVDAPDQVGRSPEDLATGDGATAPAGAPADVSMVICTKDRARALEQALEAVARIPRDDRFEVVLVDNGSRDATAEVFARFRERVRFGCRYVYEPRAGVGRAMQAGLVASRGEIVIYTDDDCYPREDIVSEARRLFAAPDVGVAQGRVLLHDPSDVRESVLESAEAKRYSPGSFLRAGQVMGANLVFRRSALLQAGGIDPLFGPGSAMGSAADIDAASRVLFAGWSGLYAPSLVVRHHHGRKPADLPALHRRYEIGRGAYDMKQLLVAPWRRKPLVAGVLLRNLAHLRNPAMSWRELTGALRYLRHRMSARREG